MLAGRTSAERAPFGRLYFLACCFMSREVEVRTTHFLMAFLGVFAFQDTLILPPATLVSLMLRKPPPEVMPWYARCGATRTPGSAGAAAVELVALVARSGAASRRGAQTTASRRRERVIVVLASGGGSGCGSGTGQDRLHRFGAHDRNPGALAQGSAGRRRHWPRRPRRLRCRSNPPDEDRPMPDPAARHEPTLSVIVPVYNVAAYLPECLESILDQSLADLEVIAVDDGSTDGCLEILRRYAAADPRLRVLTQANSGQGAARNLGVAEARGRFLTFCDSDDTVPRRAYAAMVRTLRRTGSDFAVGAAIRVKHDRARQVAWGRTVHEFDRLATTIDEFPAAMQDIIACNRVFRTAFWRDRIGGFGRRTAYEDHVPMLAAYVRADRFDVLSRVTYQWRMREDQTSTGQQKAALQNLLDRIAVKEEAYDLLRAEASEATYDAWVGRCIDIDFPPFLPHAMTGSDDYRDALATTYRTFLDRATPRALSTVRHHRAVRAWLCAERQWDALAVADEHFRESRQPAVRLRGDRLFAVPDLPSAVTDLVPPELWALADSETALRTGLRSV